jgi:hypothetical protein
MGLRCLLGHDFGEPETERQRNEEGSEVVVTVREVKTCQTCGETRVVSENKEIKSIEQLRRSAVGDDAYGSGDGQYGSSTAGYGTEQPSSPSEQTPGTDGPSGPGAPTGGTRTPNDGTGPIRSADEGGIADAIQNAEGGAGEGTAPADAADEGVLIDDGDDGGDAADPTSNSTAADPAPEADATGDEADADVDVDPAVDDPSTDPPEEDAIILGDDEDAPSESERKQWDETAEPEEIPGHKKPEPEPEGDDAVIMDADAAETEPETTEEGYTPWPDQHAEDEGHDATIPDEERADIDFGGGLTPAAESEESTDDTTDADDEAARSPVDEVADVGRTSADSSRNGASKQQGRSASETNVDLETAASDANLEYHCPDCGLTRSVGNSSMRAGDICPECHRGYITERPRQN